MLRDYQARALSEADAHFAAARHHTDPRMRRVVCVIPTGGGKSVVGREAVRARVERGQACLVLAHRVELLKQMRGHLEAVGVRADVLAPGFPRLTGAPVVIASLDTIAASGVIPRADFILPDECHHLAADTWRPIIEAQPEADVLGLTATPQRGDGRPLGDIFGHLVVGANYSELLRHGHLVRCRVRRPERFLGSSKKRGAPATELGATGFAADPCAAWLEHARGRRGFVFCRTVDEAKKLADGLCAAGVRSANVDGKMSAKERERRMVAFSAGELDVLTNVFVLTEGVDVPNAEVCMLARAAAHAGTYLQMVGRVLRPAPGKAEALLIDLPGVSWEHGLPTSDREYALEGRAIRVGGLSVRNCPECGFTQETALRACGACGLEFPRRVWQGPKIWNMELLEYFEGVGELSTAPVPLKRAEWERLLDVCRTKRFGISFAVGEYEKVFGERPGEQWLKDLGDKARVWELRQLLAVQRSKRLQVGWISHAYKKTFGVFPSRALREAAGVSLPSQENY